MAEQPQSGDGLVMPEAFPCKSENINVENVKSASAKLKSMGQTIDSKMDTIVGLWNGLPAVYVAPEAEQAYGLMAPAATASETIKTKFEKASGALDVFAEAIGPVKSELASLESEAATFRSNTLSTYGDKWRDHQEVVDRNNELLGRYAKIVETMTTAAAACANTINGLLDGVCVPAVEGISADAIMQSGEIMPWGGAVEKNRNCGESVVHGVGNFAKSTWEGVTAMVGFGPDGWSLGNFANTWLGMADFIGSTVLLASPTLSGAIKFFGGDDVDAWVDERHEVATTAWTGMVGFDYAAHKAGKDGWHKWKEDGIATFTETALNIGSNFIPGAGAGGAAAKAAAMSSKIGGLTVKAANFTTKVADFAIPGGGWLVKGGVKVVELGADVLKKADIPFGTGKTPLPFTEGKIPTKAGPLTPGSHDVPQVSGSRAGGHVADSSLPAGKPLAGPDFEAPANVVGPKLDPSLADSGLHLNKAPGGGSAGLPRPDLVDSVVTHGDPGKPPSRFGMDDAPDVGVAPGGKKPSSGLGSDDGFGSWSREKVAASSPSPDGKGPSGLGDGAGAREPAMAGASVGAGRNVLDLESSRVPAGAGGSRPVEVGGSSSHARAPEPVHVSAGNGGGGPSAHHHNGGVGHGGGSSLGGGGSASAHLGNNGGVGHGGGSSHGAGSTTPHTGGGGAGHGGGTSHGGSSGHHGGTPSQHGGAPGHVPEPEVGSRPRRSPDENNMPDDHASGSGNRRGEPGSDVPDAPRKKPDADLADSPDQRLGDRTRPEGRGDDVDRPRTDTGDPAKPRTDTTPDNHPGRDKRPDVDEHPGRDRRPDVDEHPGRDRRPDVDEHPGRDRRPEVDEHSGRDKHPDVDENPGRGEHPGDGRGDGVDGVDEHRHPDEGSGSGGDGSDHGTSGSGNDPIDDLPRYDEKGNPLYDDHGDPVEVDRGDGRKHYASDPEGTFRSQDDRLRHSDNGQFAEDPYAHRPKGIKYYARKILLGDHDWNNPALAERTRADTRIWDEARTKARTDRRAATQAINDIETLKTRDGKKLQLDTTDKSYRKLAEEVEKASHKLDPKSQVKAEQIMNSLEAAANSASDLRKVSEWVGDRAGHHFTLDHAPDVDGAGRRPLLGEPSDTPDGAKPTGAGKGDRFSTEGDSRLVVGENKGGDSPGLGSRETAAGPRAQQGTAEYVMDLLSGKNQDPRLLEALTALEHSPEHAGFYQKLKTEGVEVVYEMVNARTDGTVKVGQFDLGGKVILKLKDGQLIAEFIKKETP